MRIMGLDYGEKTVGVALSDLLGITAQGLEIIRRKDETNIKETLSRLSEIIQEKNVTSIVLGDPINMNNTRGPRCEKTEWFKKKLEKAFGLPVYLQDERLSTASAHHAMIEGDLRRNQRKKVVDKVAAVLILQTYLDTHHP